MNATVIGSGSDDQTQGSTQPSEQKTEEVSGTKVEAAGSPASQDTNTSKGSGDNGSTVVASGTDTFAKSFSDEDKAWAEQNGIKSEADLVKTAREAQSLVGKTIRPPGPDATPAELEAFFAKAGRPEKPADYKFTMPADLPSDFPYEEKSAEQFREWGHKYGLHPWQADGLHAEYVKQMAGGFTASKEALENAVTTSTETLQKEFKASYGTPDYDAKLELVDRALRGLGGKDDPGGKKFRAELVDAGILSPQGAVLRPQIIARLATVGEFYKEGNLPDGGGGGAGGSNPFASGDMTEQMRLIRTEPETALKYIAATGKQPADFNWTPAAR